MNETEYKILELFKKNPNKKNTTSEIVEKIEPDFSKDFDSLIKNGSMDKDKLKDVKQKKAQLHRKILYYLNKLVENKVLKETRLVLNGEKIYELSINDGEEIIIGTYGKRTISIHKTQTPPIPVEGYEQSGLVQRFEPTSWTERFNSIIIECDLIKSLKSLETMINNSFSFINDVIALNSFEFLLNDNSQEQVALLINRLNTKCADYGKRISCIINISTVEMPNNLVFVIKEYQKQKKKNIQFIFEIMPKDLQAKRALLLDILNNFSDDGEKLYIKNKLLHKAPYFVGKAGPYTIPNEDWELYEKEMKGKIPAIIISEATMMIDVDKFFKEEGITLNSFKRLMSKVAFSFLETNAIQRTKPIEIVEIEKYDSNYNKDFFRFSRNYVRLWNYGLKNKNIDPELIINLLRNGKELVDQFCNYESTIYKSCGMPIRFKMSFSCAFEEAALDVFSERVFKNFYIYNIKDFYDDEIKKFLVSKEVLFEIFDGGDVISFYRRGRFTEEEVLREITFILNTYRLPFFRYDFRPKKELELNLTQFIKG